MSKRKIIFRADGNSEIGMGHFVRSLALASMLKDDFICSFALVSPTKMQEKEIQEQGITCISLTQSHTHFSEFLTMLQGDEIVVLDNYYFDTEYQKSIKNIGCKLVCIDDIYDRHFVADVVINHAPAIKKEVYSIEPYTKLYTGPQYALLRPPFLDIAKRTQENSQAIDTAFICFGASDAFDITHLALSAVLELSEISKIHVVVGAAYSKLDSLNLLASSNQDKEVQLHQSLDVNQMLAVLQDTNIAFSSASTILYEIMAVRLPVFTGYYTDNQHSIYNGFVKTGAVIGIGDFMSLQKESLTTKIKSSLVHCKSVISQQQKAITGNSAYLLRDIFKAL